jgi:hypothetical protein
MLDADPAPLVNPALLNLTLKLIGGYPLPNVIRVYLAHANPAIWQA